MQMQERVQELELAYEQTESGRAAARRYAQQMRDEGMSAHIVQRRTIVKVEVRTKQ